jgi:hypothetical protein
MRVRRGYLVALAVVAISCGWGLVHSAANDAGADSYPRAEQLAQAQARRHLPDAMATLERLRLPPDVRSLKTGCQWYRCYLIAKPTARTTAILPVIMRQLGADNPQTRRLQASLQRLGAPLQRDANALLAQLGARSDPIELTGCSGSRNRVHGLVVVCAEPTVIDDNVVTIVLGPYLACPPRACRWTGETEVEISLPSGAA